MWCLFCKRDFFNVAISSSLGFLWCFNFVIPPGSQHYLLCPIMFVCWARCIHITSPIQRCVNAYLDIFALFERCISSLRHKLAHESNHFKYMERCMRNNNESFTRCSKQVLLILNFHGICCGCEAWWILNVAISFIAFKISFIAFKLWKV